MGKFGKCFEDFDCLVIKLLCGLRLVLSLLTVHNLNRNNEMTIHRLRLLFTGILQCEMKQKKINFY